MSRDQFRLKIDGQNVSPETVGLRDLVEVLEAVEEAAQATVEDDGTIVGYDPRNPPISLVGVQRGSAAFVLSAAGPFMAAVNRVVQAIGRRDYTRIPPKAHDSLVALSRKVVKRGWSVELAASAVGVATISEDNPVDPMDGMLIWGGTTLYGEVVRIGGKKPTVLLRLINKPGTITATASRAIAEVLGRHLYKVVGLRGMAGWRKPDWKLARFKVEEVLSYDHRRCVDDLTEVRQLASQAVPPCVDVEGTIREWRRDEDDP